MNENNLELVKEMDNKEKDNIVEGGELPLELELKKLEALRDGLLRTQESYINNFTSMDVDLESKEAHERLDPIAKELAGVNERIEEIDTKEAA